MIKELSTVITKGKPKQRIVLYMDAVFSKHRPQAEATLTDSEIDALWDSFKTPEEIRFFNKHNRLNSSLILLNNYLQQLLLQFTSEMYQINGFTMLWHAYQREEDLLNSILYDLEQSKDKKLKDQVTKKILNSSRLMSKTRLEEDGFISIDVGSARERGRKGEGDYNLRYLIQGWAIRGTQTIKRAKATIVAIRQVLEELGLNLKSVKTTLKEFEAEFSKDWALLPKYSRYTIGELGELGERAKELFKDYQVYPVYEEIEPDPNELQKTITELKEEF